jgi:uncharacterized integral membrane protein (TIGR00698 family)
LKRLPGLLLCFALGVAAWALQRLEVRATGTPYVEALVIAMLLGVLVRSTVGVPASAQAGVSFAGREVLETAVFLLGASVDFYAVAGAGPQLLIGIVVIVGVSLLLGYGVGRMFNLGHKLSLLVACGNAICGNSAIAAVAPVIDADADEIASAIGFTAILGVVVVLLLPVLLRPPVVTPVQYGVVAGLTVYAVPQVLAATLPVGAVAGTTGTLVKLIRVLLLGPIVLVLSFMHSDRAPRTWLSIGRMIPWFITGFLALAALRSMGIIPAGVAGSVRSLVTALTVLAMAALGLGVDVRALRRVGPRVVGAVTISLVLLFAMSWGLASLVG